MHLNVDQQQSVWEARFPTETLRADKRGHVARNMLSTFSREMECQLITKESSVFMPTWLNIRAPGIKPIGGAAVLSIDPVPPPSEREMQKGLQGKDYEAHYVWSRVNGEYHLLDCARSRGHDPSWTIATAFGFMLRYRCYAMVFEAVAYQRVLKWIFDQEMARRRIHFSCIPIPSNGEAKYAKITGVLNPLATAGLLHIGPEHTIFAEQWNSYGPTYSGPDDDLDASAQALRELSKPWLEAGAGDYDSQVEELPWQRSAP